MSDYNSSNLQLFALMIFILTLPVMKITRLTCKFSTLNTLNIETKIMGRLDRDENDRRSDQRADLEQQIGELKELICLLQFAAEEVADSQKEIRKSLEKLKNFMEKDQVSDS